MNRPSCPPATFVRTLQSIGIAVLLMAASTVFAYGPLPAGFPTSDPEIDADAAAGYLNVKAYGACPEGDCDSTTALQDAINDAYTYGMAVLLPNKESGAAGEYLIHDTLTGEQVYASPEGAEHVATGTAFESDYLFRAPVMVGVPGAVRPVLKLVNGSSGFGNANSPKPVINFYNTNGLTFGFDFVFRDIDIDLGSSNPGAFGFSIQGAQGCTVENVRIVATGAYAGIWGLPTTGSVFNIEVEGGDYGIADVLEFADVNQKMGAVSIVGLTLRNQEIAGIVANPYASMIIAGFKIEQTGATPILMSDLQPQESQVALLDGSITITGSGNTQPAILNQYPYSSVQEGHDLWISNVFVTAPGPLVLSGSKSPVASAGATSRIAEYSYTDTRASGSTLSHTLIEGTVGPVSGVNEFYTVQSSGAPPADLLSRHIPGRLPWFRDPGVVDVTTLGAVGDGVNDDTDAIQDAINQSDYVFVPRGDYVISGTLTLYPNTHLFGTPGMRSRFYSPTWDPNDQFLPVIQTADTATGATYLGDIAIKLPPTYDQSYLSGLDWRAGRRSIVNQVTVAPVWDGDGPSAARKLVHVRGNGGGRWYGLLMSQSGGRLDNTDLRGLFVDGTTEPLTLYGPNFEHAIDSPFVEINGARNVRILGTKTEDLSFAIVDSHNVMIAAHTGNDLLSPLLQVSGGSDDISLPIIAAYPGAGSGGDYMVYDAQHSIGVTANNRVSLFKLGEFDASPFAFATKATDDFNRSNGGLGSNWTVAANSSTPLQIASNQAESPSGNYSESLYTAADFADDQFSQVQYVSSMTSGVINLVVRARQFTTASTEDGYVGQLNGTNWRILRVDNQVETQLASGSYTYANGDTFTFEAVGSTLTLKKNGATLGSTIDATYSSGDVGFGSYNVGTLKVDNWRGGDLVIGADNFNRANGGLGSNWTVAANSSTPLQIASNQAESPSGNYSESLYTAADFADDQFSQVQYVSSMTSGVINLVVRARQFTTASTEDGYVGQLNGTNWRILRVDNQVETQLASGSYTYANGDTFTLEVFGSTLTLKKNGVNLGSTIDATYSSGDVGFGSYNVGTLKVDNWRGGDL